MLRLARHMLPTSCPSPPEQTQAGGTDHREIRNGTRVMLPTIERTSACVFNRDQEPGVPFARVVRLAG